jgi:hypothetical protein
LSRAFATDKPPTWKKVDILILSNWRELHINPKIQAKIEAQEGKLPGLQDWSPKAVAGLFQLQRIDFDFNTGNFEEWFTKRRKRLGLPGKYPHKIKDFIVYNDAVRIVR